MEDKHNLLGVLSTLFKWKKWIIIICALAAVGSILLALMQDNFYESSTLFYAANHDLAKPDPVGTVPSTRHYYGSGEDMDRIMTIAQSKEIANYLIDHFDLYTHYNIDSTSKTAPFAVRFRLGGLYNVTKTKHDAVKISVEDKDPQMAADIANAAREKVNEFAQQMIKESQARQIASIESNIADKEKTMQILSDSLRNLQKQFSVVDPWAKGNQLQRLMTKTHTDLVAMQAGLKILEKYPDNVDPDTLVVIRADIQGLEKKQELIDQQLALLRTGASQTESISIFLKHLKDQISLDIQRLQQLRSAYKAAFTSIHLVEKAPVPIVKSRPHRTIIVLASVFVAFVFAMIGVLLFESYKEVNWRKIIHGQ